MQEAPPKVVDNAQAKSEPRPAAIDVAALFGRANEIRLLHRGQEYRLRITKSGKLILTK